MDIPRISDPPPAALLPIDESVSIPGIRVIEADASCLDVLYTLNLAIFDEDRIINTFDRDDLLILIAYLDDEPVGFKIGYRESRFVFYSAKGGVLPEYRRRGIAHLLLQEMVRRLKGRGYIRLAFDTFPNRHPGMTIMALRLGFRVTKADFNPTYRDYRLRFEKKLP